MRGFRIKPNLKKINLQVLKPEQVEYFCTTKHIDRKRCNIAGLKFNEDLANFMEEKVKHYFLVKTNQQYDVVSGIEFDKIINDFGLIEKQHISDKAEKCINHYINALK